ncbi:TGF-beta-activated kinase 1 and MAP3K7-binding protein 1 [Trichoplax sp. H2]|nr:TGF-beta-activated kinase 1 and MAP3K7-binding protein 1 [Trichoplax sp. H2]|eukprot:RDD43897.1 TGF-beta-activated kinase 1 and MAP3K7-binding protein 1 [Trichoplax sp. H2]
MYKRTKLRIFLLLITLNSVSLSEPITAKPDIRGGYPINYDSWHFLVLMSSGIYKVLEAHSNITDPNIYIAKLIWSKLERGKDINDVSQQVVNEICRTHRACFNDQRSNCWYHEDMTLLVRSFGHSKIKRQSQLLVGQTYKTDLMHPPSSLENCKISPNSDKEAIYTHSSYQSPKYDRSMNSASQPFFNFNEKSAAVANIEANPFDKQICQKHEQLTTSLTTPSFVESISNRRLNHSISTPSHGSTCTSSCLEQSRKFDNINPSNNMQDSKVQSYSAEQVSCNRSNDIFQSDKGNHSSDYNGEFGKLVVSEVPFTVKRESSQVFISDDLLISPTKPAEAKMASNLPSESKMSTSENCEINKFDICPTEESSFGNSEESNINDTPDVDSGGISLLQVDRGNGRSSVTENVDANVASLDSSYADSYVNFSPLEETLRKYGVEIDELVDGS